MKIMLQDYNLKELALMSGGILRTSLCPAKIINFILVKISRLLKLPKSLGLPINILVEPTRHCNYECPQCPRQTFTGIKKLSKMEISQEEFSGIMRRIGKYLLTVRLWHYGEPLLNKELPSMIRSAKKFKVFTVLSSNCSLLEKDIGRDLIASGLDYLLVSLNAATGSTHKMFTQRDNFTEVVNNLKQFIAMRNEMGARRPFVNLQFIVMRDNFVDVGAIKGIADSLKVDKLSFKCPGFKRKELGVKTEGYQVREDKTGLFCSLPYEECIICANGEVVPCASDIANDFCMGNIFENDFASIWNGTKYRNFRQNSGAKEMCRECNKKNNPDFFIKI